MTFCFCFSNSGFESQSRRTVKSFSQMVKEIEKCSKKKSLVLQCGTYLLPSWEAETFSLPSAVTPLSLWWLHAGQQSLIDFCCGCGSPSSCSPCRISAASSDTNFPQILKRRGARTPQSVCAFFVAPSSIRCYFCMLDYAIMPSKQMAQRDCRW